MALVLLQGVTDIDWTDVVLETKIGAGAFGNVYKAKWKGRAVAVKVMLASPGEHASELESFRQEVRAISGITLLEESTPFDMASVLQATSFASLGNSGGWAC